MERDDRNGIVLSVTLHLVVLLLLAVALRVPPEALDPDWPPQLTEIEFGIVPVPPVVTGPPERAEAGESSEVMTQPEPERPAPPAATPVRIPERTPTPTPRRPDRPLPRPTQSDDARPSRPNPPSRATQPEARPTAPTQPRETDGTGTSQGTSPTAGADTGSGSGSGGDAPAEVGFQFGNRTFDCPSVPFGGVVGTVRHRITFAPNGRYVADRPVTRNGPLNSAVEAVIRGCRAQPLPRNAAQVNDAVEATFRFSAN